MPTQDLWLGRPLRLVLGSDPPSSCCSRLSGGCYFPDDTHWREATIQHVQQTDRDAATRPVAVHHLQACSSPDLVDLPAGRRVYRRAADWAIWVLFAAECSNRLKPAVGPQAVRPRTPARRRFVALPMLHRLRALRVPGLLRAGTGPRLFSSSVYGERVIAALQEVAVLHRQQSRDAAGQAGSWWCRSMLGPLPSVSGQTERIQPPPNARRSRSGVMQDAASSATIIGTLS